MVARVKAAAKRRRVKGKGFDRLVDKLERRGRNAKKALRDVMNDDDPKRMLRQIGRRIRKATAKASRARQGDDHRALVRHFASSVITRRYESVLAFELVLPASFDVLHRLRVVIKKLRYAVDFFAEALGESVAGALDAPLQTAQDQLGDLHDHQVVRAEVAATARRQGSPRELALLQKQGDAESKRLLAAFARTWKILVGRSFTATLEKALGGLLAGARRA